MIDDVNVTARVRLTRSRLQVELVDDAMLHVRSFVDPGLALLLPLPAAPAIDGVAGVSRLSRVYDLSWGLAYGTTTLPPQATVAFSTSSLRFRRTVTGRPQLLGEHVWLAEAEGEFTVAALVVDGVETARTALTVL